MQCIKTGCDVFLDQYGEWVHGDAFETEGGDLVIRASWRSREPTGARRHFTVLDVGRWFDERAHEAAGCKEGRNSTIVVDRGLWTNHGYQGVAEPVKGAE